MCLAVPGKIIEIYEAGGLKMERYEGEFQSFMPDPGAEGIKGRDNDAFPRIQS